MTPFQIFSLCASALGLFLIALVTFVADRNRRHGFAEGRKVGVNEGWEAISYYIRTSLPLTVTLRGADGLASVKEDKKYIIVEASEYENLVNQSGTVSFSEEPEKDEAEKPTTILMWVKKQDRTVVCSRIPFEQVPKGLWGKTLCASTSFHGWKHLNSARSE